MSGARTRLNLTRTGYCVAFNLRKAARSVTQLYDGALRDAGVRSTQLALLVATAKYQPVSIGRLAELTVTDSSTLSRSLRVMRSRAWVTVSKRSQQRQRFVQLTAGGRRALARALAAWRQIQARLVRQIGAREWRRLRVELEELSAVSAAGRATTRS
jgi:DNA-binding MarR family transcriptional regulator